MSKISSMQVSYTTRGLQRFEVQVSHPQLKKIQVVKGDLKAVVAARAEELAERWDEQWAKKVEQENKRLIRDAAAKNVEEKKQVAIERTAEAAKSIENLQGLLAATLGVDDAVDWDTLKDESSYSVAKPEYTWATPVPSRPEAPQEPRSDDSAFQFKVGILDLIISSRMKRKEASAKETFESSHEAWLRQMAEMEQQHQVAMERYEADRVANERSYAGILAGWEEQLSVFRHEQALRNAEIDERRESYRARNPEAFSDYCCLVLDNSEYPDVFTKSFDLEYNPVNHIVVVDYQLPAPADIPTLIEVKYVATKDEFTEKAISAKAANDLYDSVLYQAALRTIHELFEADVIEAVEAVVFNGWVHSIDLSTGIENDSCVLSIQAGRAEFLELQLSGVDPKACFKKLKGVSAAKLHAITPVPPLMHLSREDKRFVQGRDVAGALTEGDNLAAMSWEDFEHLIRELFEKEFSSAGAEVRVTQASRDGGVDAVIFNPDPLHGGKTVIQAKRWTNTVGVSAVRDLYGTMMNEGANKGILVTTSDYGPDAYDFVKDKPMVLLTGGNLLHLLESHGHKARIDLAEAKLLAESAGA